MGLFDFLKKNNKNTDSTTNNLNIKGNVDCKEILLYSSIVENLKKRYIAFDIETTGLDQFNDRIVELGAVLFENGIPIKKFSSLVNPNKLISPEAMRVNNISNEMVFKSPNESIVYPKLIEFLGDSLSGETIICAHNAKFDIGFLSNTLERLGYSGNIRYVDTLNIARDLLYLDNYKQSTIAEYFDIINEEAHRAVSDAETCGKILFHFLNYEIKEKEKINENNLIPLDEYEKIVFAYIEKLIYDNNFEVDYLGARKNSSGYVDICCLYRFIKYKFSKKGKYLIIPSIYSKNIDLPTESCNMSEGGSEFVRAYFKSIEDIQTLSQYIFIEYRKAYNSMIDYIDGSSRKEKNVMEVLESMYKISHEEANTIVNNEFENRTLDNYLSNFVIEKHISREDITINPINDRVPLEQIKNLDNRDKGFDDGYKYWVNGDELRKNGNYEASIEMFDLARFNGYDAPVLYESYAMSYHQLKDYDNEIDILEEGINRLQENNTNYSSLVARRDKAVKILYKFIEQEQLAKKKLEEKEERKKIKEKEKLREKLEKAEFRKNNPKTPVNARAILQMDDEGNIIKRFSSIAEAEREIGVNSKSIRDAAKGIQKHAGGFCWKYEEEMELIHI